MIVYFIMKFVINFILFMYFTTSSFWEKFILVRHLYVILGCGVIITAVDEVIHESRFCDNLERLQKYA